MSQTPSMPITNEWLKPRPQLDGVSLIDHLFNRMDGLYLNRWRAGFANEKSVENWRSAWASGLEEEGISPAELKCGLSACQRRFEWPPSFAEFVAACRPAVEPEVAFGEAVMQMRRREDGADAWSHPAIFWAAVTVGEFDLRNASWSSIKSRWTRLLQAELAKGEWPEIPVRRVALPAPGATMPDPEKVKAISERLARKGADVSPGQARGAWLRLKERFEAGENIPRIARDAAEAVLGERFVRRGVSARPDASDRAAGDRSFDRDDGAMVAL